MTTLLCRLFLRGRDPSTPTGRRAYGTMAGAVGIALNLLLAAGKFIVGVLSGALSVQADAVNNLSDAGSQIISLVSFRIAARPADREHPFGHARIEYVASMIVSFAILLVGWELLTGSVRKILHPEPTAFRWLSVIVLGVSALVKLWMFFFNRSIARRIGSSVMRATAADSLSDAGATCAVLVCMLVLRFTGVDVDAYAGVAVALLILWGGIGILRDTKNAILGSRPSEETVRDIRNVVRQYPDALGMHDLLVHNYGPGHVVASLHIEVDGRADVFTSHDMIDRIERQLRLEYGIEATVHMDPIAVNDPTADRLHALVLDAARELDGRLRIHDFRIVPGATHTNLIFDLEVPFEVRMSDTDLRENLFRLVRSRDPSRYTVVTIDRE